MIRVITGDGCIIEAEGCVSDTGGVLVLVKAVSKCSLECPRCDVPDDAPFDRFYLPIRKTWIGMQDLGGVG